MLDELLRTLRDRIKTIIEKAKNFFGKSLIMDFKEVKIKKIGPIIHAITIGIFLFTLIGILFILRTFRR